MQLIGRRSVASWLKILLDVFWYLLLLVALLVGLRTVYAFAAGDPGDLDSELAVRLQFDAEAYLFSSPDMGIEQGKLEDVRGKLAFSNPQGIYAFAVVVWAYIGLAIGLVVVYQLRKLFQSLARQSPFDPANGRRVRIIALTILFGHLFRGVIAFAFSRGVSEASLAPGITLEPDWGIDPFSILFALIILVLAEVFRLGAEMKAEQDLTV